MNCCVSDRKAARELAANGPRLSTEEAIKAARAAITMRGGDVE